jgi:HEAT repeat protein
MPRFYGFENPPRKKVESLVTELRNYPDVRPLLTFPFTLNERRRNALEMIATGKIDIDRLIDLLKSEDFVERNAGFYILSHYDLPKLSKEKKQIILSILEQMGRDQSWEVRMAVAKSLRNLGEEALSILEELSRDKYSEVRRAVAEVLGNLGEEALSILEELSRDIDFEVRIKVAKALGNLGEKALPILEKLSRDRAWTIRVAAIQSKISIYIKKKGESALSILKELSGDESYEVRIAVAEVLGNLGEEALPILKKMSKDEERAVRRAVAEVLGNLGERGLSILKELSGDIYKSVRIAVAKALGNLGEKALPILEELSRDENKEVREAARSSIVRIKGYGYKYLLPTQKPLFATPETKELLERLRKLRGIAEKLKERFGDDFIGIVILGSMAKGYLSEESDTDYGIIATDLNVLKEFRKMAEAENLNPCSPHYAEVKENEISGNKNILFCGIFLGDEQKLRKLQKIVIQTTRQDEWDGIRRIIMENETRLFKAAERFNIPDEGMEKIKICAALLRVPPSYDEMIEIVKRRASENLVQD